MKPLQRMVFFAVLLCAWLAALPLTTEAACIEAEGGIGGTGMPQAGGIGGTGIQAQGGIGGTGIIGTITGFGSVCVNGLEVEYDETTRVDSSGQALAVHDLAIGQVIALDAVPAPAGGGLIARRIDVMNLLEGPISAMQPDGARVEVMGQTVHLSENTVLAPGVVLRDLAVGTPLQVSGYRNASGEILATRLATAPELTAVRVLGEVVRDNQGRTFVAGIELASAGGMPPVGAEWLVEGKWDGQRLHSEKYRLSPALEMAAHVRRMVVEGMVLPHANARLMRVGVFEVDRSALPDAQRNLLVADRPVRMSGEVLDGMRLKAGQVVSVHHFGLPSGMASRTGTVMPHQDDPGRMQHDHRMRQFMPGMNQNRPMPMMRH